MEHIVSFSGGKDSTAMLIEMLEIGMQVDRIIFADTLYEFPEMYEYIKKINDYIKKYGDYEIEVIKPTSSLEKWIFGEVSRGDRKGEIRGWPLVAFGCAWSREAKQDPLNKIGQGNISYIGIAIDEKERMAKNWEEEGKRYPLIDWGWTEAYCIEYLKDKGLHNPLYDKFDRLGCYWCPKQSIDSLYVLYRDYPDLWNRMLDTDNKINKLQANRSFKPGVDLKELDRRFNIKKTLEIGQLQMF